MATIVRSFSITLAAGLLVAFSVTAFAAQETYALDPDHTQVHIHWNHLGFSNPGASFKISKGKLVWDAKHPEKSSVSVTIPVDSVDTQVPALDARFKSEFFEAQKYPDITFESTRIDRRDHSSHYLVQGKLTVHGITRPVTLHATLNKRGEHPMLHAPAIGFDAKTTIKRSAFGLKAYVPAVSDKVHIRITGEGVEASALANEK